MWSQVVFWVTWWVFLVGLRLLLASSVEVAELTSGCDSGGGRDRGRDGALAAFGYL